MKVKNLSSTQLLLYCSRFLLTLGFICGLQACGGSAEVAENPSLTPTTDALKKDWVDQGTDQSLALGKVDKP